MQQLSWLVVGAASVEQHVDACAAGASTVGVVVSWQQLMAFSSGW
ncbi:hypothetical protein AB6N24_08975 [Cellulomonas sp. 179-A 4D5 NHS]